MYDIILTCNYSPWSSYSGGGQKSTHMAATALAASGKKVCVIYSKGWRETIPLPADLRYDVAWAFFFAWKPGISSPLRFLNGLSFFFKTRKLSGPATVLHGNGEEASLLGFIPHRKAFIYSHRYPGFEAFLSRARWNHWWNWLLILLREPRYTAMALALRRADAVTCTSLASQQQLLACFQIPASKTQIIPNGIDPIFLGATLPENMQGVLYFGRITHAKGVDVLLRAFAELPERQREAHGLKFIGDGPYLQELRRMASDLGLSTKVTFASWANPQTLTREIVSHGLVVLPSREESFGNTMLEVLATGQRLLTTDAGSIPEVVRDFAWKVPAGDIHALSTEMSRLLEEANTPEQARARIEYVRGHYSWERTAAQFLSLYDSVK